MKRGTCKWSFLPWLAALSFLLGRGASAQLSITFLDVGQGDAAIIRTASHKVVLIDAGPSPTAVASQLRLLGVDTIDLAIASHNHSDHIGGMPAVLSAIPVRNYMENGMAATTRTYARIVTLLEEKGIPVLLATPRRINLGDSVVVRILAGSPRARTQNDASVGVEVVYGSFRALFTGDAEARQRAFWAADSLRPVSLLKVSHHGSANGTDAKMLRSLHPCVAVISVGAKNGFHHPSATVLRLLESSKIAAYRTDRMGKVTVTADTSGAFVVDTGRPSRSPGAFGPTCAQAQTGG